MGRKGVNKRKPKAVFRPVSKTNQSSNLSELVRDNGAPVNKAGANPLTESNKAHKKGN